MSNVRGLMALLIVVGVAGAVDLPEQQEGLWSSHRIFINNPGKEKIESRSSICRNHAYDAHVRSQAKTLKGCTVTKEKFSGTEYVLEDHCVVQGTTIDSKGVTTIVDGNTAHAESHTTYSPALNGVSEMTLTVEQKFLGPCPAGMQAGDQKGEDGQITHLWKH